jgi:hypothetical protein
LKGAATDTALPATGIVVDCNVESDGAERAAARLATLAPRPSTLAATGLTPELLGDLASKLLLCSGVLSVSALSEQLAIAGNILTDALQLMRREARIEVRPGSGAELSFGLTERGRALALEALHRDAYVGAAPVRLEDYARLVAAQTVHDRRVTRASMKRAFADIVISDDLLDRLGSALNSGRAIFLHGAAGTGKSYLAHRLERALPGEVLVPHALLVNGRVLRLFDPVVHEPIGLLESSSPLLLQAGFDSRYVCCERPVVHVGGELEISMLEIGQRAGAQELLAPVQMKANNGILIIDDLGRQRSSPEQILNRWIVPMEERIDHHSSGAGTHFRVPFDVVLVFSTNLKPEALTDDALLRRLGYKIAFHPVDAEAYRHIWQQNCAALQLPYQRELADFAIQELHRKRGVDLMPCHPRDLLNMVVDRLRYDQRHARIDRELLTWAWDNYFLPSR